MPDLPPLWDHQVQGVSHLRSRDGAMLAMEMGTGKTRTTIEDLIHFQPPLTVIVCPKAVVDVWPLEFSRFAPDAFRVLPLGGGSTKARGASLGHFLASRPHHDVPHAVVVNFEALSTPDIMGLLAKAGVGTWVVDESHRIKTATSKANKALFSLTGGTRLVPGERPRVRLLTGTPMTQGFTDIFGQYKVMHPWAFGTVFSSFRARYAMMGGFEGRQVKGFIDDEARLRFEAIFQKYAFVVRKADVLTLPEASHVMRVCELSPPEMKLYRQMKDEFVSDLENGYVTAGNAAVKLMRLSQIASGAVTNEVTGETTIVGDSKAKLLFDTMEDIAAEEPLVIFCRFKTDLEQAAIQCKKAGRTACELSGARNDLAAWQGGLYNTICVQLKSGGVGIDLTRSCYSIYFSQDFSLGDYEQSLARLDRPRQTREVTHIHLVAKSTVDAYVYKCLSDKKKPIEGILNRAKF